MGKLLELLPDLVHEKGRKYHLEVLVECSTFKTNILKYIHTMEEMLTIYVIYILGISWITKEIIDLAFNN